MNSEIFDIIINEYENQRSANKREREKRVKEVYTLVPEIEEIDKKIAEIGRNTLMDILSNQNKEDAKESMHSKFDILKQRKKELLKQYNISENYDKMQYKCPLCMDTGHIEGKGRCVCFKQKVINILYEQSNMSEIMKNQNFDTFDISYFSKSPYESLKKSPYENMMNIKSYCENFIENFDSTSKSLVFYGDTGVGKTFMSSCIAKAVIEKGKTVLYLRASRLFRMFDDDRFGKLTDGMKDVYDCDLLIIDDLGTEASYKNNNSYLLELVNERVCNNKKIIINTNLNFKNLEQKYTKRLSSRILENFTMLYFYGEDIRRKKLFGKR